MKMLNKIFSKLHMDSPSQVRKEIRWLFQRGLRYRYMVTLVCVIGLVSTLMGLGSSVATKYMVDAVTGQTSDLLLASVLMVIMTLGGFALQALASRISANVHVRVRNDSQGLTFGKILHAGWEALEPYRSGDLLHRLETDSNTVSDGVISFFPNLLTSVARFGGSLVIMLFYDPTMAVIALLGVPVTLLMSRYQMHKLRSHSVQMKELGSEVMSFQEDSFRNLTSIKAFSIVDHFEDEMRRLQGRYQDAFLSYNAHQIHMNTLFSLVSMLVTTGCFGWAVFRLWTGDITYGSMTMFLQLAGVLRSTFSSLVSLAQQGISLTTSAGRIMALEDLPRENDVVCEGLDQENRVNIQLKQVSFHYQNGDTLLHPFDFSACDGDQVAIMGPSGEGKTTLLRILLGLVEPCSGTAELVGDTGTVYPINAGTRNRFAYVPQENSIFTGTIAHNLRIVAPEATEEEMVEALKVACAWEFVQQLPEGLNHPLSTGGRGVSEGQAQRLAIARALLRKAPVLLLDEATSGLDVATERRLMENLRRSGMVRTCILVTHRTASAEFCNRAYEIHEGQISEVSHGA